MTIRSPSDLENQCLQGLWRPAGGSGLGDEPVLLGEVVEQVLQALSERRPEAQISEPWAV
jgi:hypothetical protein